MKRFISIFMALLLLAVPMTACSKKPANNPEEPAGNYNKSAKYDTMANIKANTPATFKKEMDNIVFDGIVLGPKADSCYNYTFKISQDVYHNRYEELRSLFIDDYSPEFEEITENDKSYRSDRQAFGTSGRNGAFGYQNIEYVFKYAEVDAKYVRPNNWVEMTRFYRGEAPSETEYVMIDGTKLSMKKAAEQLNEFLANCMKKYDSDFDFAIRTGFVRQKENCDFYTIEFVVCSTIDGITVDPKTYYPKCNEMVGNITRFSRTLSFWIPSANGYKTWSFGSGGRICKVTDKKQLSDKFITFESALELLRREITALDDITLDSAEFCYVMSYDGYSNEVDEFTKIKEYHARPEWTFTSPFKNEEFPSELRKGNGEMQKVYTVDAVTGAVAVYYELIS